MNKMSDRMKRTIRNKIDIHIRAIAKIYTESAKISQQMRELESKKTKLYEKEEILRKRVEKLVQVHNADDIVAAYNSYCKKQLEEKKE